jgi:hypothetical protein
MKVVLLISSILLVQVILITGMFTFTNHNICIIGGEYDVHKGEIVKGNLRLAFAQVTLEEDSQIEGEILSFSSTVNGRGSVSGNISSIESDIKLETPAKVTVAPRDRSIFPYIILLPRMARWNLFFGP